MNGKSLFYIAMFVIESLLLIYWFDETKTDMIISILIVGFIQVFFMMGDIIEKIEENKGN